MLLLNGQLTSETDARISPLADGFMIGAGVFTTLRVRGGRVEFLAEHTQRLRTDATAIGLQPLASETLRERCATCIAANQLGDSGLKITWFADAGGRTSELILPRSHAYDAAAYARGFRLKIFSCAPRHHRSLWRHKTLNYLEHAQAKRAALAAGFDEALWIDETGAVLEGATSNLFAVIGGEVFTPPVAAGILPGVARSIVLRRAQGNLPKVREAELTRADLAQADELFLTNSLMAVMPVRAVEERHFAKTEVSAQFAAAFSNWSAHG